MICTERGSKLVSAANYTVMSRHQSYDVLSCSTMPSLLVMAIAYLSWSLSSFHPTSMFHPAEESKWFYVRDGLWISYFVGTCTDTCHSQRVASKK